MIHKTSFLFHTPDAQIIAASLIPDSESGEEGRSHGECRVTTNGSLEIQIRADDLSALRAALNTWLRLVQIAEEMVQTTKKAGTTNE